MCPSPSPSPPREVRTGEGISVRGRPRTPECEDRPRVVRNVSLSTWVRSRVLYHLSVHSPTASLRRRTRVSTPDSSVALPSRRERRRRERHKSLLRSALRSSYEGRTSPHSAGPPRGSRRRGTTTGSETRTRHSGWNTEWAQDRDERRVVESRVSRATCGSSPVWTGSPTCQSVPEEKGGDRRRSP